MMSPASNSEARQGRSRPLLVQKFGGTSVGSIERIRTTARRVIESQREGNDVVVVVSAMSGETDRLLGLARQILPLPNVRELDVIVATGEQVSVGLTAMAIQAQGGQACSLLGHQLPLLTDSAFTRARIHRVEQGPIREALARGQIAVVAGFQGVDASRNITTLGRGGSDTTAVALAAALGADVCEIYTDVEGIYTADPRVCPSGRKLTCISYEDMLELASLGAKVLQVRSVEIAMKYQVPVHVRSSFIEEEGTLVVDRERIFEARALTGLACTRGQVRIELIGMECHPGLVAELTGALAELNICADMLGHSGVIQAGTRADIAFTLSEEDLVRIRGYLKNLMTTPGAGELRVTGDLAKVSMVGIGIRSDPAIAARLCRTLTQHGIVVSGLAVNELRISCLVNESVMDQTVRILHEAFGFAPASEAQSARLPPSSKSRLVPT